VRILRHWWRVLLVGRFWALVRKEFQQILRDRQLDQVALIIRPRCAADLRLCPQPPRCQPQTGGG